MWEQRTIRLDTDEVNECAKCGIKPNAKLRLWYWKVYCSVCESSTGWHTVDGLPDRLALRNAIGAWNARQGVE